MVEAFKPMRKPEHKISALATNIDTLNRYTLFIPYVGSVAKH